MQTTVNNLLFPTVSEANQQDAHAESPRVELSIVVPTYKAEGCLRALHERLTRALGDLGKTYELIFVEDGSPDSSWSVLMELADSDTRVSAYKLSRNFGQQMAITAGLSKAQGNWIVVMDCDLQDPPEFIEQLYERAQQGFDIVYATRKRRPHGKLRLLASKMYFAIVNLFGPVNDGGKYGSFNLFSRRVKDAFLRFSDVNRHYLMILKWLGFQSSEVEYEQSSRYHGESSYGLYELLKLAVEGVFFQTTSLLKFIVVLGLFVSFAGFLVACWAGIHYILHGGLPGWTSLTILILLLGGANLVSQGVVGLYVGEIFDQVKQRPLFIISREYSARVRNPDQ